MSLDDVKKEGEIDSAALLAALVKKEGEIDSAALLAALHSSFFDVNYLVSV